MNHYLCKDKSGNSSEVEHQLPKLRVAGSNPVSRSFLKKVNKRVEIHNHLYPRFFIRS